MAKSKLVNMNKKIGERVTSNFQKVSDCVVGTYIKVEDKFVDQYLSKDGESIEDAKLRLAKETKERHQNPHHSS